MSGPYDPQTDRRGCYNARYVPLHAITDADMVGIAVSVANVVVGLCLRILITWSPTDIDVGIQGSLFQIYPILLSTLLSIKRQELSLFDATFALTVSSSPLMIYLVFASIGDLLGFKTGLYKRIKHRHTIRTPLLLVPLIWLGLSVTLTLSNQAFRDSVQCDGSTFKDWLADLGQFLLSFVSLSQNVSALVIYILFGFIFSLCLFRRWSLVMTDVRAYWRGEYNPWGRVRVSWVFVKCVWCTLKRNHVWCIYFLFCIFDTLWAFQVITSSLNASKGRYGLSYGQLLSLFAAIPPLISTLNFFGALDRDNISSSHFLGLISAEVRYLVTGVEPDPTQDNHLPFAHRPVPLPESRPVIQPEGVDEGKDARSHADGAILQELSPPEGVMAGPSDSPVHPGPEPQHRVSSKRSMDPGVNQREEKSSDSMRLEILGAVRQDMDKCSQVTR